jgi:NADPH:quinone reductase-like Zn-dependent oxidoreductase
MKAAVYHRYGGPEVVMIAEVPKPTPKDDEVLVRISATTVSTGDWRARSLHLSGGFGFMGRPVFGFFGPRRPILGTEFAGVVESVGSSVTRFKPGDAVFGFPGGRYGSHAEYRVMPQNGAIALKPANLTFEEAAALSFGGANALFFLRKAGVKGGDRVLVVGASGSVGSAAVQIARHLGATVTAVTSTANVSVMRSLGADEVIDYTKEDFAFREAAWDVILDTTGTAPLSRSEKALRPGGRLVVVMGTLAQALGLERPARGSGKKVVGGVSKVTPEDLRYVAEIAASGAYRPLVDRVYPFEKVSEAHAYVEQGHKRGNVVMTIAASPPDGHRAGA